MRLFPVLFVCLAVATPLPVVAQQQVSMGGLKPERNAPVEVTADSLSVAQDTGVATFKGNVLVVQGDLRMKAPLVVVNYDQQNRSQIQTVHATGGVTMTSPTEAAQSQEAVYDVASGHVVMTGDVVLTQGENVLSGPKLTVDTNTNTGVMEGGRVRTVIQPQQATPAAGAKP